MIERPGAQQSGIETTPDEEAWLRAIAPGLRADQAGFWVAGAQTDVSYPASAHEKLAAVEDESFWFRHRGKMILAMVDRFPPAGPIFDIGGGGGQVAAKLVAHGWPTWVLEPSNEAASLAQKRGLLTINGTFHRGIFVPSSVPAIGLFDVIEHIEDDASFLSDCHEALIPGGHVYVTVPSSTLLWSSDDEFAGHYRRYDQRSLTRILSKAGFEVVEIQYFFSLLVLPVLLLRALPSWIGWRRVTTPDSAVRHHRVNVRIAILVEKIFGFEVAMSRSGYGQPLGTSVLAVARKSDMRSPRATRVPSDRSQIDLDNRGNGEH
jgi:SAM-dependent methyltransferase